LSLGNNLLMPIHITKNVLLEEHRTWTLTVTVAMATGKQNIF
jgi:hypothetical protein